MNRSKICALSILSIVALCIAISCSSESKSGKSSRGVAPEVRLSGLSSESDSLAYIVGMNIAEQLRKMDSTINISVVCRAIIEQSEGDAVMSQKQAREDYLRYLLYVDPEQRRSYEEQFLADLAANNRDFTRTRSGLTYHIDVIGDESLTPQNDRDWVTIRYSISRIGGEEIITNHTESGSTDDFVAGVGESVKLIGKGGKIESWLPSKIAYGEEGEEEMGIKQTETLFYTIELVDMERGVAADRKKEIEAERF